ncbi:MATE family efflux transporter [Rhodospirillaceae bacterium KN72]|uniref:MATE family efflux transporter n=1 Tax=Pacificispira spongiicola TaxID=2729598 RepID=A0A7Y0HCQ7_9PROT|nr:MATE family efflux transporter [Pacificispira spongiicola]NMM42981.1 MATE family efflux transporter [Pacificispira spongiicola]
MSQLQDRRITFGRVSAIALPVVLSNAMVPLQGAIDTAIIGHLGAASYLAAVALGAAVLSLVFSVFNFLQMGVSGLTAQALGARDNGRVLNTLARAVLIALTIAALLVLAKQPIRTGAIALFDGSPEALELGGAYVDVRLWGAPVELLNYALMGWFAGQGLTRRLFEMQMLTSIVNIGLNVLFVVVLGWGVEGVALGTVLATATGVTYGGVQVWKRMRQIRPDGWVLDRARVLDPKELRRVMALNRDIMIRTLMLTGSLAWMTRLGSMQGDVILAANGILLQFIFIASNALDGFALATESLVGQAIGARSRETLRRAVVVSTISALATAAALALIFTALSDSLIALFTNVADVRETAGRYAIWATLMPLGSALAYQFDGVFNGATQGAMMRNAMIVAAALYVPIGYVMTQAYGNHGLWGALWIWMGLRALTLAVVYPRLESRAIT